MEIIYLWCSYIIIGTVLLIGKAITCRVLGIYHDHYQIGYPPSFVKFKFFKVTFSIGLIIPLPWLFKIYEIHDNKKRQTSPIWTYRNIPVLKRMLGILGGVVLLYLMAILINALHHHATDRTYLSANDINKNGISVDSLGIEFGLQTGDKVIRFNGEKYERYSDLSQALYSDNVRSLTVNRNDSLLEIEINIENSVNSSNPNKHLMIYPIMSKFPLTVDSVLKDHNAYFAGLVKGDKIISVNHDTVFYYIDFVNALKRNMNSSIILGINRNDSNNLDFLEAQPDINGKIGAMIEQTLTYTTQEKSLIRSLNSGNLFIKDYLKQLKRLFFKDANIQHYGGFISIGEFIPEPGFWRTISMIMLIYISLSLIPTPITDTRFLAALLIDQIIRLPNIASTWIGWIVFLSLLLLANANDIIKIF